MKTDFKPVMGHRFNLRRADWGAVDCLVMAVEPNKTLHRRWGAYGAGECRHLDSCTPTSRAGRLRMEQAGFRRDQQQADQGAMAGVAAVPCRPGAAVGADRLRPTGVDHSPPRHGRGLSGPSTSLFGVRFKTWMPAT